MGEEVAECRGPAVRDHQLPEDNSVGRLLTLSDGVFAIAMTLLALDLKVPSSLGNSPTDGALRHALENQSASYLSFLVSFYIIASYWRRHRHIIRSVITIGGTLIRDNLALLLVVAATPFPASLLGQYGSEPISLAIYGTVSAIATVLLLRLSYDVRRYGLADPADTARADFHRNWHSYYTLAVFLLCIPTGYMAGGHGPLILLLLLVPSRFILLESAVHHLRVRRAVSARTKSST